jgi:hypothetical protein
MTLLKIMVVCLALANVFYFLWTHEIAAPPEAPPAPAAAPGRTLMLVSEGPAQPGAAAAGGAPDAANGGSGAPDLQAAGPAPLAKRCVTVGPFRDVAEAAHAASTLRTRGYDPRQRVVDGEVWAGVWVYLPLSGAPGAAEPLLAKLKAAGIDDALEMPGPGEGSVISLGLFSEPKRAQSRVVQAQSLGLKPEMTDRKRSGNLYWVDIDLNPSDGLLNPAQLQGESGRISRLEVKSCESGPSP